MPKPTAVLISDVHFNMNTLQKARTAVDTALAQANRLRVPLIVAGDLHDTKANLRGECVKSMIEAFDKAAIRPTILVGNHDKINEKSLPEEHSLHFLAPYATLVSAPSLVNGFYCVPYQSSQQDAQLALEYKAPVTIMHQGLSSSNSGEYFVDHSALSPQDVAGRRIISGHYHVRQDIVTPNGGLFSYIGNPYTLGFGEAKDPNKGYQVLMDDGSLVFILLPLPRHYVVETTVLELAVNEAPGFGRKEDLLWVKVRGAAKEMDKATKEFVQECLRFPGTIRLDLIRTDDAEVEAARPTPKSASLLLLDVIDSLKNHTDEDKARLKGICDVLLGD